MLFLCVVPAARADIGIEKASRTSGVPGQRVSLLIYCGGCATHEVTLPIYLLSVGSSPSRHPCRGTSCASRTREPPAGPPFTPLGIATPLSGGRRAAGRVGLQVSDVLGQRGEGAVRLWVLGFNELTYTIPDIEPGLYTYVLYCRPCGNSLIGHPERRPVLNRDRLANARASDEVLRVLPGGHHPPASRTAAEAAVTFAIVLRLQAKSP